MSQKDSSLPIIGGVIAAVTYETKLAVVTFNDETTSVGALTEATRNAGYPSTAKK